MKTITPVHRQYVIWTKEQLQNLSENDSISQWMKQEYEFFSTKILDKKFPCIFASVAYNRSQLSYTFATSITEPQSTTHINQAVIQYLASVKNLPPVEAAMRVLLIFIKVPLNLSVQDYHLYGWKLLQNLHEYDSQPWPSNIPVEPDNPHWSFCLHGMPIFVNISTPANIARKSRNLGGSLVLVMQPRDGFDVIAGDNPHGREVRQNIRNKLAIYDSVEPFSGLGHYGDPQHREWIEYGLGETNTPSLDKCPFSYKQK